ncbi:MAG: hypothetical protein IKN09_04680 [Clostridia bacterium]|nr:hypothetical protein [Clostridia bacterium]MBR4260496.1 hypothetical protein [Clostridia bacterium]
MINQEYSKAFTEVLEILKFIDKTDLKKIPQNLIESFENNSDKNYSFRYDTCKSMEEQDVSYTAKCIIALLYKEYWADEVEKSMLHNQEKYLEQKSEELKHEKYNADNIFKDKNTTDEEVNALVVQKESILSKLIKKIKSFFRYKSN